MDTDARRGLVERIHASPVELVLYVTGGGVLALTDLRTTPGASATVLDARVPYSSSALHTLVGRPEGSVVSPEVARDLAEAALDSAHALGANADALLLGVSCTAALTTTRDRRGADRAFVGIASAQGTAVAEVALDKDGDTRQAQDRIVSDAILLMLSRSAGQP